MTRLVPLVILFLGLAPFTARPQPPCAPFEQMAAMLMVQFGEIPAMRGPVGSEGKALGIIFINPMTQSYSVVMQRSDGMACIVLSGRDLEALAKPKGNDT